MPLDRHKISVIVPTVGRDSLALCRTALERQTRPPDEIVIVVDEFRRGVVWARNEGIARSSGDVIAFADDDVIPPADWLERLVGALDRCDAAAAGGTFQETDPLLDAIRRRNPFPEREQMDHGGLVGNSGNLMIRRQWLARCQQEDGYVFNPCFGGSGEDWELMWRLRKRGARMVYVPSQVQHLRRAAVGQHLRHSFQRGVGIARLFLVMRCDQSGVVPQDSLLWGTRGQRTDPRWFQALWTKLIGPFDGKGFQSRQQFWVFWLGEKCQAAGFLWELVTGLLSKWLMPRRAVSQSAGSAAIGPKL